MDTKYSEFLFQTLYILINNPKEEYDTLFGKISISYNKYLASDVCYDDSKSEYDAIHHFLKANK
jgi:hypothetical protein